MNNLENIKDHYPLIISIIINFILVMVISLFITSKDDNKKVYENEIQRIELINDSIMLNNLKLYQENVNTLKKIDTLNIELITTSNEILKLNDRLKKNDKNRKKHRDDISRIPNDSIGVELTKYIQHRRKARGSDGTH